MLGETLLAVLVLSLTAFYYGRSRAIALAGGDPSTLHSRPVYHGSYIGLVTFLAGLAISILLAIGANKFYAYQLNNAISQEAQKTGIEITPLKSTQLVDQAIKRAGGEIIPITEKQYTPVIEATNKVSQAYYWLTSWGIFLASILFALLAWFYSQKRISLPFRARIRTEKIVRGILFMSASVAILTTIGILLSLIGETLKFFSHIPLWKFLFGTQWSPLSGVFEGKINENSVGAIPLFAGTLLITIIAMAVAVPIGLLSAIYLSEYATQSVRSVVKPVLEILAGIPTVVYGFFAAITVAPFIRYTGEAVGLSVAAQSALAAGLVMGLMIIPFISSLSDDVINAVPQTLRDGSLGLGATKAETVTKVVLPAALPGIVSSVILAVSRAIGETMIVVMAAGQGANLTINPLESVTTVTVQIVMLITGDTEAETAAGPAFALGFTLFFITLLLNVVAARIVMKYREKYD